jgi:signal transduction histidine kinase
VLEKRAQVTFTDADGRVWFGFTDNTILIIGGTNVRTFSAKDGIQVRSVKAITGRDHHVWVGGDDGVAVWEGDRFRAVVPVDGDTFHGVSGIQEDSGGDLFLSEERGVVFILATEVSKILKDPSARIQYQLFDVRDGLPGPVQQSRPYPSAVQSTDGRIWFSTSTGVAWTDPAHIPKNLLEPPIVIRSITANGIHYNSPAGLRLPPRTRDLTIDYTALSLAVPDRVRFRYKLEGLDRRWQDAGTRRQAFYTNLSPGQYRFRVIACNNDGVWNESGAMLSFFVIPAWYQTNSFRVACFLAGLFLLWVLHRLRMQQAARALSLRFDERLFERTRIAREFHDTLLQTIQGSKLVTDDALDQSADPAKMRRALEQLSVWLNRAIGEGRAALNSLRTSATETNDLAEGLRRAIEECRMFRTIATSFSVEGDSKELHPVVRAEVYLIGYEAIRNASAHSKASQLHVGLKYGQDLAISVGDNGVGIPESIINGGADGHYGLQGMRERAANIGGKLRIVSSVDSGTEVSLVIPGRIAFRRTGSTVIE